MRSWMQPLPCEGVVAAVLGAALGVVLALDGGLAGKSWTYFPTQLGLMGIVVLFALSVHFTCTAVLKRSAKLIAFFGFVCVANAALFNWARLKELEVEQSGRIAFLPDNVALSVTTIFFVWLFVQLLLTTTVTIFRGR